MAGKWMIDSNTLFDNSAGSASARFINANELYERAFEPSWARDKEHHRAASEVIEYNIAWKYCLTINVDNAGVTDVLIIRMRWKKQMHSKARKKTPIQPNWLAVATYHIVNRFFSLARADQMNNKRSIYSRATWATGKKQRLHSRPIRPGIL